MRILVVNPNTNESVTQAVGKVAQACAAPGTEIVAIKPRWGPESIEGYFDGYLSAVAVLDRLVTWQEPFDAVIIAGFGEPGREAAQQVLSVPVFDIAESAAHMACLLGRSYSIVTSVDRTVPQITDRLRLAGLADRCASVRATGIPVLGLQDDLAAASAAAIAEGRAAIAVDRAEVICLGCAAFAGLGEQVSDALGVPVVDGVAAAVKFAEAAYDLDLRPSKVHSYAQPEPKQISGWPLTNPQAGGEVDHLEIQS